MELRGTSATLERANAVNRPILENALIDHDKHYWCLCRWIEREMKKPKRSRQWWSGPEAIGRLLGEGSTAATVIWETYQKQVDERRRAQPKREPRPDPKERGP